jgi:hypothetical protein
VNAEQIFRSAVDRFRISCKIVNMERRNP